MKSRVAAVLLASVLALMGTACSPGRGDSAAPAESGKIVAPVSKVVVGLEDQFPPMTFRNEKNELVGFDIDMAREAAKRVGCDIEFRQIDWGEKEAELYGKNVDMLWTGATITKIRQLGMQFTHPYLENRQSIVVRNDSPIHTKEQLAGKTVALQQGSTAVTAVEADPQVTTLKEIRQYESIIAALGDLEKGLLDAVILDEVVGRYYIAQGKGSLRMIEEGNFGTDHYGVAMRREDTQLMAAFQQALNAMKADGTSGRLSVKWFGRDIVQ